MRACALKRHCRGVDADAVARDGGEDAARCVNAVTGAYEQKA